MLHLVVHRTLYLSRNVNQTLVRTNDNHVAFSQTDVAGHFAVEYVVVDVNRGYLSVVAEHLYVSQCTDVVGSSSHIQCVEYSGKSRQGVGSRCHHLAHDVHRYCLCLSYGEFHTRAFVSCSYGALEFLVCLVNGQSCQFYWSIAFHHYRAVRCHHTLYGLLGCAVYVDVNRIARSQTVVLRCGNVHVWLEVELRVVENVATKHFFLVLQLFLKEALVHHLLRKGG